MLSGRVAPLAVAYQPRGCCSRQNSFLCMFATASKCRVCMHRIYIYDTWSFLSLQTQGQEVWCVHWDTYALRILGLKVNRNLECTGTGSNYPSQLCWHLVDVSAPKISIQSVQLHQSRHYWFLFVQVKGYFAIHYCIIYYNTYLKFYDKKFNINIQHKYST